MFVEAAGEKLAGDLFAPPPILNRVKEIGSGDFPNGGS